MRKAGTALHHARWRPRRGAILEAGAAVRTLVARLVTGGDPQPHPNRTRRSNLGPSRGAAAVADAPEPRSTVQPR